METKEHRQTRIEKRMKAQRDKEAIWGNIDQSKPGWSESMTWQELLDARTYPNIRTGKL